MSDNATTLVELLNTDLRHAMDRIAGLEAERDRLKAALSWYADVTDYDLSVDAGERARAALCARYAP